MVSIEFLLAALPFVLLFVLIVGIKWSVLKAMPLVWFLTMLMVFFVWKVDFVLISASFVKGILVAGEIVLIIFGAIWVVQIIKEKKHMKDLQSFLSLISEDARVQVLIIAWLFGSLIEGVAGFGTPAMLVAPLLVSLGFAPVLAVVLSLIANSTAVSFGAAGLPVILGIGSLGFENLLGDLTKNVAIFHGLASLVVPLFLVYFVCSHYSGKNVWRSFFAVLPFALFAWLAFIVPYFLIAWFLGPELPTIVGGIVGLFLVVGGAKIGFLVPKKKLTIGKSRRVARVGHKSMFLALFPYFLVVLLLFLSRTIGSLKAKLSSVSVGWESIFGSGVSYGFLPFFTPAFYFFVVGVASLFIFNAGWRDFSSSLGKSWKRVRLPALALVFALALVQLLLVSGDGSVGLGSVPVVLAQGVSGVFENGFVLVSPLVGAFGSFLTGSNTVSNLLFGSFQVESAKLLGISLVLVLSLQVVGGAVGNMIAIHNVLAASSSVGLYGVTGKIIRKTIVVSLLYALIVGFLGLLLF